MLSSSPSSNINSLVVRYTYRNDYNVGVPPSLGNAILARTNTLDHTHRTVLGISWSSFDTPPIAHKVYVAWDGQLTGSEKPWPSAPQTENHPHVYYHQPYLEIDTNLGKAFELPEGTQVSIKICRRACTAERIYVVPHSPDDWELVQMHAENLEVNLLKHVQVVFPNMLFPAPLGGYSGTALLKVESIEPTTESYAFLDEGTELIVQPCPRSDESGSSPIFMLFRCYCYSSTQGRVSLNFISSDRLEENIILSVRIHPDDFLKLSKHLVKPGHANETDFEVLLTPLSLELITPNLKPNLNPQESETPLSTESIRCSVQIDAGINSGFMACSRALCVLLAQQTNPSLPNLKLNLHGVPVLCEMVPFEAKSHGIQQDYLVQLNQSLECLPLLEKEEYLVPPVLGARSDLILDARNFLYPPRNQYRDGSLLVVGSSGTGKSSLIGAILLSLDDCSDENEEDEEVCPPKCSPPTALYISGLDLCDLPTSQLLVYLEDVFVVATGRSPCIVAIDDVNLIIPSESENDNAKSETIACALLKYVEHNPEAPPGVRFVLSAPDIGSLNQRFVHGFGIGKIIEIGQGGMVERRQVWIFINFLLVFFSNRWN
jgi:peroxin-1